LLEEIAHVEFISEDLMGYLRFSIVVFSVINGLLLGMIHLTNSNATDGIQSYVTWMILIGSATLASIQFYVTREGLFSLESTIS